MTTTTTTAAEKQVQQMPIKKTKQKTKENTWDALKESGTLEENICIA